MAELSEMEAEQLLYAVGLRRGSGENLSPHGTYSAYMRHLHYGDEPCAPCRKANADYKRSRRGREVPTPGLRKPIAHGTLAGYQQHRYRKQDACDECKRAARDYQRGRKGTR